MSDQIEVKPEDVEEFLPEPAALVVQDTRDENEVFRVLDAHDEAQILDEIQRRALKVALYDYRQGGQQVVDLSYQGVNEAVRVMNATGKVRIGIDPSSLTVEKMEADVGNGPEDFFVATVYAREEITGYGQFGTSMEPINLRKRDGTRVFDVFARTKAINKSQRNALKTMIPEQIRQTLIAAYKGDPTRVERIMTATEKKEAELPPADTSPAALALVEEIRAVYEEIKDLGGGQGRILFPPGRMHSLLLAVQHDQARMKDFLAWIEEQRDEVIPKQIEGAKK